jgi:hypothetical protein
MGEEKNRMEKREVDDWGRESEQMKRRVRAGGNFKKK